MRMAGRYDTSADGVISYSGPRGKLPAELVGQPAQSFGNDAG